MEKMKLVPTLILPDKMGLSGGEIDCSRGFLVASWGDICLETNGRTLTRRFAIVIWAFLLGEL